MSQSNPKPFILSTGVEREHHFSFIFNTEINVLTTGVEREHQFSVILHAETLLLTMGAEREHQFRFILHIKINVLLTGVEREQQFECENQCFNDRGRARAPIQHHFACRNLTSQRALSCNLCSVTTSSASFVYESTR